MRLDKYLKVSRLIKRRTVANEACDAGRVLINDKPAKASSNVFARLLAAGQRLLSVIQKNEGIPNKDLAKFADQINSLADKWDR